MSLVLDAPIEPVSSSASPVKRQRVGRAAPLATIALAALLLYAYALPNDLTRASRPFGLLVTLAFYIRVFQFHLGATLLVLGLPLLLWRRRWAWAIVATTVAAIAVGPDVRRAWPKSSAVAAAAAAPTLRVMSVNQLRRNDDVRPTLDAIARNRPDVVLVQEYDTDHDRRFPEALRVEYPHQIRRPHPGFNGFAVFAKHPLTEEVPPDGWRGRWMRVGLRWQGRDVAVYNVHPTSPGGVGRIVRNRAETAAMVADLATLGDRPAVMAGDFNFTPTTPQAAALRRAGLTNADDQAGGGLRWTWGPRVPLLSLVRVRIDHVYSTAHFAATSSTVEPDVGSDHRPIVVDLVLRKRQRRGQLS